jgi:hypothetical protein
MTQKPLNELSDKEYRAIGLESFSSLKHLLDSPDTFTHYKNQPFKGSPSTVLGTAVHHYIQGNQKLVAVNEINRASAQGKKDYAALEKEFLQDTKNEGVIITKSTKEKLDLIYASYLKNKTAVRLISLCDYEVPFITHVEGIEVKGKLDGVMRDKKGIVEIKTTSKEVDVNTFRDTAQSSHYDAQAALYQRGLGLEVPHYFIVCQTTAPFKVSVFAGLPGSAFMKSGNDKVKLMIQRYTKHIVNGEKFEKLDVEEL